MTDTAAAKYTIGQLVHHRMFDYRGVIVDVDPQFKGTEEWYEAMARSRPPKDKPWYHVLVHDAEVQTYVAERNLRPDDSADPINHPDIAEHFSHLGDDGYVLRRKGN
ncbi:MAG: heat shock protein HspQ [Magnetovibrio sp.]|nr:heat shock protein HspQ [Magnetovibrio sp.]